MLKNYIDFVDEGYLKSNFAPLYHRTTTYGLYDIINSNMLSMSEFENIYNDSKIKMVSLTRNKK